MTMQDQSSLTKSLKPLQLVAVFVALGILAIFLVRGFGGGPQELQSMAVQEQEEVQASPETLQPIPGVELVGIQGSQAVERRASPASYSKPVSSIESGIEAPPAEIIEGQVALADGTRLPEVTVYATLVGRAKSRSFSTQTDEHGAFRLGVRVPGAYKFTAFKDVFLPVLGTDEFSVSASPIRIEVDALLLKLVSMDASDQVVPMSNVGFSVVPEGEPLESFDGGKGGRGSSRAQDGMTSYSILMLTTERAHLYSSDKAGKRYKGVLEPGLPSGLHQFFLNEKGSD